jgi:hypothetical protein
MVYLLRKHIKTKRLSDKLDYTKLGPFKINKKLGLVTFRLEMPEGMRIYPVFHILLLEPALKGARLGLIEINKETQQLYYKAKVIVKLKLINNKLHYLIY